MHFFDILFQFEFMIETVIHARDRYLKPVSDLGVSAIIFICFVKDGVMWPSHANLYLVPCSAHKNYNDKVSFWSSQYGFDLSPLMYAFIEGVRCLISVAF